MRTNTPIILQKKEQAEAVLFSFPPWWSRAMAKALNAEDVPGPDEQQ
jgi:hypothetical protein